MSELPISSPYRSRPDAPVTDSEREQLNARLNAAYTDGRLSADDYANFNRYTVSGDEGWQLEGGSITTKGADKLGAINLLLDTGSSVSMLPASRLDAMMKRAGVEVQRSKDEPILYSMACDTKLGVQLVLPAGTKVAVDDSAILMRSNDANMPGCLSLLVGTTNPFVPAVAGTPLLQSLYTVLSRTPRGDWIGLAPL